MIAPINIYSWDDIQTEVCDLIEYKYGKCANWHIAREYLQPSKALSRMWPTNQTDLNFALFTSQCPQIAEYFKAFNKVIIELGGEDDGIVVFCEGCL